MESDGTRWDDRYADHRPAAPAPPEVLEGDDGLTGRLPSDGRALDVACGTGAQSLWLAGRDLDVVALDVSTRAVELTRTAAAAAGLADRIEARVHDLDDGLPDDLGRFDVVVCQRFRDPRLYGAIADALQPGGIAIVTVLSAVGLEGEPGPFHAPAGELRAAFTSPALEMLVDREAAGVASVVVQRSSDRES